MSPSIDSIFARLVSFLRGEYLARNNWGAPSSKFQTDICVNLRLTTSEIFELTAQKGELQFRVHKDVLVLQSEPFRNATTGAWKEATEKKINLNDWDGNTVGRLVEFLYTGDYQCPDPDPVSSSEEVSGSSNQEDLMGVNTLQKSSDEVDLSPNRPLTPLNQCLSGILPQYRDGRQTDEKKLKGFNPMDGYQEALLSHAKVYCLAHYKSIQALQHLALERILMILLKVNPIQPDSPASLNFIDLVNYVYSNTDSLVSSEEPLRKLISQFGAFNLEALQRTDEMAELMGEGGDFVNEVMLKVCRRLKTGNDLDSGKGVERPAQQSTEIPIVGRFDTREVRDWQSPRLNASKIVSFRTAYPTPPGVVVGLNMLNIGKKNNTRIITYASDIQNERFSIHIDRWLDTKIYYAGCTWLQIPSTDLDFQFGSFCTLEDHSAHQPQTLTSRLITFPRAYAERPTVVVWLTGFDISHKKTRRVKTYATDITATSFVIHIDTWADSVLYSGTASWLAYPSNKPGICSGRFSTLDVRRYNPPLLQTSGHVDFTRNILTTAPRMLLALNSIDISRDRDVRIKLTSSSVSTTGMDWHIDGWANTILYSAGASYIALA